jgi:hypothetical protein
MSESQTIRVPTYYTARPSRWQLMRALLTGKPMNLGADQVTSHVPFTGDSATFEVYALGPSSVYLEPNA